MSAVLAQSGAQLVERVQDLGDAGGRWLQWLAALGAGGYGRGRRRGAVTLQECGAGLG